MELSFLCSIPRTAFLDAFFLFFTKLPGSIGQLWLIVAALVAFSRLYLFLHFPTDVLCGIVLGIAVGFAAVKLCELAARKIRQSRAGSGDA